VNSDISEEEGKVLKLTLFPQITLMMQPSRAPRKYRAWRYLLLSGGGDRHLMVHSDGYARK
jgi:hypothetical protein